MKAAVGAFFLGGLAMLGLLTAILLVRHPLLRYAAAWAALQDVPGLGSR